MLENWPWHAAIIKMLSKHFETGAAMPDGLVEKLVKSRNANGGVLNSRQLALGLFDQAIHTAPSADTRKVYER